MNAASAPEVVEFFAGDGMRLNLIHYPPKGDAPRGPILLVHGAGVRAELFSPPMNGPDHHQHGLPHDPFDRPPGEDSDFPTPPPWDFPDGPHRFDSPPALTGLAQKKLSAATTALFEEPNSNGFYFAVWLGEAPAPAKKSARAPADLVKPAPGGINTAVYLRNRGPYREAYHALDRFECTLVGCNPAPEYADARRVAGGLLLGGFTLLALVLTSAWWLVGRALQPVEKITAAALKISSGDLSQRINVAETESELGRLAAVLNATFTRLETAFVQQKQFTSDAAHELRTPLAVLISEAQTILARERRPADYRDSLAACLATAQKMRRLTEALLELARLDAGQETLHREPGDLAAIVQDCVSQIRPLAAARRLQLECDLGPAQILCDPTRLAEVVTNLLTNAINYNHDGGQIRVTLRVENHRVHLAIADTGCGIAAADLPRVFERFYRADPSRSAGGNGLGLSISRAILTAHNGTIEVTSQEKVGTTFTVVLPAHGG